MSGRRRSSRCRRLAPTRAEGSPFHHRLGSGRTRRPRLGVATIQIVPSPHSTRRWRRRPGVASDGRGLEQHDLLAVERRDRRADAGEPERELPGAHLVVDTARRLRPVDPRIVVVLEVAGPGGALGRLRIARVAGRDALERRRQERRAAASSSRGPNSADVAVVVPDRVAALREDVARVELGVHAVPGEAPLGVAGPQRPGERDRPAMARQQRRMPVDRPEPRDVERALRDLPGEAPADRQVGLVGAQQPLDRPLVLREEQIDARRRARRRETQELRLLVARRAGAAPTSATGSWPSSRSVPASTSAIGLIVQIMQTRQESAMRPAYVRIPLPGEVSDDPLRRR